MLTQLVTGLLVGHSAVAGGVEGSGSPPAAETPGHSSSPVLAEAAQASDPWVFSITPYAWLYGMDGDVRIRNTTAEFDVGFDDLLENLDIALMVHLEAWKGRLGFFVDPSYGRLLVDAEVAGTEVDLETDMILVDFGALYRVLDHHSEQGRSRTADVSIGGRYMYLKNEVDFSMMADRTQSGDFIDLTVGARYGMDLTEKIGFLVEGDVGGFEFGSSSEFAWNLEGLGSYRIGKSGRLWAGYRILDIDRDEGGSSGIDFQFSGPIIGFEFRF